MSPMAGLRWYKLSFDTTEYDIYEDDSFPVGQIRSFSSNTIEVSQKGANYVGVVYYFTFAP